MIRLFRNLRQSQLGKNNASRYLLYATGEILLVVIGILIALQINNWNESEKDRAFEKEMLSEVQSALEADQAYFNRMIRRLQNADSTAQKFFQAIAHDSVFSDELKFTYNWLFTGIQYEFNPGPYEAIKASGLDRLSNKTLRNRLISFYDFTILRNRDLVEWAERNYTDQVEQLSNLRTGPSEIRMVNNTYRVTRELPGDLLEQEAFLLLLDDISDRIRFTLRLLQPMPEKLESLSALVQKELADD
ncbi:DUF6090 family protein [Robiginitalea sp. IMCC44478]|uniref:DUF6090 family protein n=1 Tax=Robiginitalea sp. IMCC44478 TaxID=3459122 RepID=UPI004041C6F5